MRTYLLVLALSVVASSCKSKPKPQEAPGSAKVEKQGSASKKEHELPHADGTPPKHTTAPVKPETFKSMSELTFPGFNLDVKAQNDKYMWVYQKTPDSPVVRASIHVWPCVHNDKDCFPMDLDVWKTKHMDELQQYLTPKLKEAKDTKFEVGMTDVYGEKMIYSFQLGEILGGEHNEFTYCYILWWNDGINEIRVLAEYKDDLMRSQEDMEKAVPRESLENLAKSMLDVYTHHWQT